MFLALLLIAACPAGQVQVHGVADHDGKLDVYTSPGAVEVSTGLVSGKPWAVCVKPTDHPINPAGFFVPWYVEVHRSYKDGTSHHERWRVPQNVKSVDVKDVITDGQLR